MADNLTRSAPADYQPVVQSFLGDLPAYPPLSGLGVRYAIAQGPSLVPMNDKIAAASDITLSIETAVAFNMHTLDAACSCARNYHAQMISFPELFLSGYEFGSPDTTAATAVAKQTAEYLTTNKYYETGGPVSALAKKYNVALVCPGPYAGKDPAGNEGIFDTAAVFNNTGAFMGRQFKTQLWGSEERQWFSTAHFPTGLDPATSAQSSGNPFRIWMINDFPVGIGICYDAEFPEVPRALALNGSLLTIFPTAAPDSILPGQIEPYPDIAKHYIPANALTNLNFCSYSNRAGNEMRVIVKGGKVTSYEFALKYSGNSIICNPYGEAMVKAVSNQHTLLIADCVYCDYPWTQPHDTQYLYNRRPELMGILTSHSVPIPERSQKAYVYPTTPPNHTEPVIPKYGCTWD